MSSLVFVSLLALGAFQASPSPVERPRRAPPSVQVIILELPLEGRLQVPALEDRLGAELGLLGFLVRRVTIPRVPRAGEADVLRQHVNGTHAHLGVLLVRVAPPAPRGETTSKAVHRGEVEIWLLWEIRSAGRVRPALGLGGGALGIWTRGAESLELVARQAVVVVGDVAITAQLALRLHRRLALRLGAQAGLAIPRVSLSFADQRVATFGAPHLAAHLAMEARF